MDSAISSYDMLKFNEFQGQNNVWSLFKNGFVTQHQATYEKSPRKVDFVSKMPPKISLEFVIDKVIFTNF